MLRVIYFGGKIDTKKEIWGTISGHGTKFQNRFFFFILNSWWIFLKAFIILVFVFNWLHALLVTAQLSKLNDFQNLMHSLCLEKDAYTFTLIFNRIFLFL